MFAPTHYYNAYDDGDEVVIDTHRIDRLGNPAGQGPVSSHEWFPPAYPWQLRVNTVTGKVGPGLCRDTHEAAGTVDAQIL
jgi:carotenoid cleavage dioxygenase-like enzyme